jgi:hypothetical protein
VKKKFKKFSENEFKDSVEKNTELIESLFLKLKLFEYKFISIQEKEKILEKSKEILGELEQLEKLSKEFSWYGSYLLFKEYVMKMGSNMKILFLIK